MFYICLYVCAQDGSKPKEQILKYFADLTPTITSSKSREQRRSQMLLMNDYMILSSFNDEVTL